MELLNITCDVYCPGERVIGIVDKSGKLRIGHVTPDQSQEIKWKTIAKNIIDLEISTTGLKSIKEMTSD